MKGYMISVLLFAVAILQAEEITLERCLGEAARHYPLVKQYGLIERRAESDLANAGRSRLPQISLSAKASYQSDVTQIPASLGQILSVLSGQQVTFESLDKDQYQFLFDIQQTLWDGGAVRVHQNAVKAAADAAKEDIDVQLYPLRERVQQLYFGIMLIESQLRQVALLRGELEKKIKLIQAGIENGVAQPADADAVKVELIKSRQQQVDLTSADKSSRQMLSLLTGLDIQQSTMLVKPDFPDMPLLEENRRPELRLFDAREKVLNVQKDAVRAANMPKVGLFLQAGYANPALNMFDPDFNPLYLTGIRLVWNPSERFYRKDKLRIIDTDLQSLQVQKETFLFNTKLAGTEQLNNIEMLQETVKNDADIVALRRNIKKAADAKYANGTMTVSDLLTEITAENLAEQIRLLHEIQLYLALYQLKYTVNQ